MRKLKAVDLCCSAGLASEGYAQYFEMTGVDIDPQPHYPYEFVQADATTLDPAWLATFDLVVGSPPCQRYTTLKHRYTVNNHPDLIGPVRGLMRASGRPYVIPRLTVFIAQANALGFDVTLVRRRRRDAAWRREIGEPRKRVAS